MNSRKYLLYADDDLDDREMMEHAFLVENEYLLLTFPNGEDLLHFLNGKTQSEVALIVLDINMPILNGMETLKLLKANGNYKEIPTVMFSTSGSPKDRAEAAELGTDVLLKPSSFNEVQAISKTMLGYCRGVDQEKQH
ncbi:MAG: response regulator [Flaviaesturariibacter sp.]|nr:response regulator [Flaviaesturariibacter sp.]